MVSSRSMQIIKGIGLPALISSSCEEFPNSRFPLLLDEDWNQRLLVGHLGDSLKSPNGRVVKTPNSKNPLLDINAHGPPRHLSAFCTDHAVRRTDHVWYCLVSL
jgi:hypothetical protein